jgi:hypothetical protein
MDIRFADHPSFHRAAAGMVLGGAAAGLALHPLSAHAPIVGGLAGIAIGTAAGYGKLAFRIAAAALASIPLFLMAPSPPMLAAVACTMGLGVALFGLRGARGLFAMMFGAATTLLAIWAAVRVTGAHETHAWPAWARDTVAAGAMSMIGVIAMLPRHLAMSFDPVGAAVRRLPTDLDAEVRELCNRSLAIWSAAKDKLDDPGRALVRDGVMKTLEVATKSADVKVAGATDGELAKRMEDLDARIASATDAEVKSQYQSARGALDDQRRYRDHIKQNRERLIARMHNHVAALEKFQLAAGGLAAVRAATAGAQAVKQLEELSADVAASGEALAELELGSDPSTVVTSPAATNSTPAAKFADAVTDAASEPSAPASA